jgi:hypothetical protein
MLVTHTDMRENGPRKMSRKREMFATVALAGLVGACSPAARRGTTTPVDPPTPEIPACSYSVAVAPRDVIILPGNSLVFHAARSTSCGALPSYRWSVSDTAVITVTQAADSTVTVHTLRSGDARLFVRVEGDAAKSDSTRVVVVAPN